MGRPRRAWALTFEEVRQRYEEGESAQTLAVACGLVSYQPILRSLREAGVVIRPPGGPRGPRDAAQSRAETRVCEGLNCQLTFRAFPSRNKRFCSPRCRYTSPDLADLIASANIGQHVLSDIDETTRVATCCICGDIDIRERHGNRKYSTETRRWRCRGAERERMWRKQYGLEAHAVRAMWEAQKRECAICRVPINFPKFFVDHSHVTGRVRGLLCPGCNAGIGFFADDPVRMHAAIKYVQERR